MIKLQASKRQIIILIMILCSIAVVYTVLFMYNNIKDQPLPDDHQAMEEHDDASTGEHSEVDEGEDVSTILNNILAQIERQTQDDAGTDEPHEVEEVVITIFDEIMAQIERQAQVDEMMLAELNSGEYTFDDPLIVADPYGMSPLSALALFKSDEEINISIHVPGKTNLADVDFTFIGYNTAHIIPVYGLYPNELNKIILTAKAVDGSTETRTFDIQTEPLPSELASDIILVDLVEPDKFQHGFNYVSYQNRAFDVNGDYRWFYNDFQMLFPAEFNYNGNMIFAKGTYHQGDAVIMEVNALGRVISVYYSPYGVHHCIIGYNGGNLIISGSDGETIEDLIYEIDVLNGEIVNTLDLKTVLQRTRDGGNVQYTTRDWLHHNATVYENGNIIISGKHQGVVKLSWPDGKLEWILSDHTGWNEMFRKYLLTPVGDDFEWPYDQHSPRILPDFDNDPDTIDILLFDNGGGHDALYSRYMNNREFQRARANNEIIEPEHYSRMVHYRINERNKTIEQIWQFGKELGDTYFSPWRSVAHLLENGNRLGKFDRSNLSLGGHINNNFIEVDEDGNIIWEAYATSRNALGSFHSYHLARLPLYNAAANDMQIGVAVRNFIPEDKLP
jgi:arylsulfate sulfotransferase